MSWVDPYPFIESIHTLNLKNMDQFKSKGMDWLNKRVWIDFKTSLTIHTVCFFNFQIIYSYFFMNNKCSNQIFFVAEDIYFELLRAVIEGTSYSPIL